MRMQFDYEIPAAEYANAQILCHKTRDKYALIKRTLFWISLGSLFVLVAVFRSEEWGKIFVLLTGIWFLSIGIVCLFPSRYFRRQYPGSGLAGKSYHAELDEIGFLITGDSCSWRVLWPEVRLRGEDKCVFMFSAKSTIFIFGKKFLTDAQQKEIRQFAALQR